MTDAALLPRQGSFGRRILAVSLPRLSTDRLRRKVLGRSWHDLTARQPPLAVLAKIKNALRIVALDETGERLGLFRGQALADARAMIPYLDAVDEDQNADRILLEEIADWAERYTPLVALNPPSGLLLEITGAAHLFGGEQSLVADLAARLHGQGFFARIAIADTPGAAFAAARYTEISVVPEGASAGMLAPLPFGALRLDGDTVSAMERVGLKSIGQILGAPRSPLAARFGNDLLRKLDQALGIDEEAISPRRPLPAFIAERRFAEPMSRQEDISATLTSLAATLGANLETYGEGARRLEFSLFRVDGVVTRISVGAGRPIRAPKLVLDLFREKFASFGDKDIDAGFGFDMARLSATASAPADPVQIDITGEANAAADLAGLIDRIGARLGAQSVSEIIPHESHVPERAEMLCVPEDKISLIKHAGRALLDRPLRLFASPEPVEAVAEVPDGPPARFRWRRVLYRIARAEGPERIAAEWWHEDALMRDYFRVEDADGRRFWLYREGLYGNERASPRWYLHGVFA